jgi:predicted nucleotidyltransferase
MTPITKSEADKLIAAMVERIVGRFKPEKVILFGSRARGEGTADSDADLLVVMSVTGSKRQQAVQIDMALTGILLPADIIVITPEELQRQRDSIGSIIRQAVQEGQVLYDRAA